MNNPYRSLLVMMPDSPPRPRGQPCRACRARAALKRRRLRTALASIAVTAFVGFTLACAADVLASTQRAENALEAAQATNVAILTAIQKAQRPLAPLPPPSVPPLVPTERAAHGDFGSVQTTGASDTERLIDRRLIDELLEDQAEISRHLRIAPEVENGAVAGVRVFGIGPRTLLGELGFRNGDRIDSINGYQISTPDRVLQTYARLRTSDTIVVSLKRGDAIVELRYQIY